MPMKPGLPGAPVQLLNPLVERGRVLSLPRGLGRVGADPLTAPHLPPAGTASIVIPILLLLLLLAIVAFVWYKWRIKG